jgi:hypothetical protein
MAAIAANLSSPNCAVRIAGNRKPDISNSKTTQFLELHALHCSYNKIRNNMYKNITQLKRELPPYNGCSQQERIEWENVRAVTNPARFGPSFWFTLHNSSLNYPLRPSRIAQKTMKAFIEALPMLLPCQNCSAHAMEFLSQSSLDQAVRNRQSLFYFFWRFHNHVNERLGKPHLPFLTALKMYNQN